MLKPYLCRDVGDGTWMHLDRTGKGVYPNALAHVMEVSSKAHLVKILEIYTHVLKPHDYDYLHDLGENRLQMEISIRTMATFRDCHHRPGKLSRQSSPG